MKIRASVRKVQDENSNVKGYAELTVENCCVFRGIRIVENSNGELFVSYPQKVVYENGQPKLHANGKQMYSDVYYANSKEANDAIKGLVLEAYNSEEGYAYINPEKGEFINARIEPNIHSCNGDRVKASGRLEVGGYMKVTDVFVNLCTDDKGDNFLAVSYPHYKSSDGTYKDFVEPLENGRVWDSKAKEEKDYNFKMAIEGVMKKQTKEFHPELADVLKSSVQERIDEAKVVSEGNALANDKEVEKEPNM